MGADVGSHRQGVPSRCGWAKKLLVELLKVPLAERAFAVPLKLYAHVVKGLCKIDPTLEATRAPQHSAVLLAKASPHCGGSITGGMARPAVWSLGCFPQNDCQMVIFLRGWGAALPRLGRTPRREIPSTL